MKKIVTIGLIQTKPKAETENNLAAACLRIEAAAQQGAQIMCLPELFLYPYFCQHKDKSFFELAEEIPGTTTQALGDLAKKTGTVILIPLFEKTRDGKYFNSVAVMGPKGEVLDVYHKMHIPSLPPDLYAENFYFEKGDRGFLAVDTPFAKIAPLICYDQWFPEGARIVASQGAKILFYPTAIGWPTGERAQKQELDRAEHEAWQIIQRSHSIANNVFVAAVNRVGTEKNLTFWGTSFVSDPYGRVLTKASTDAEETRIVECDLSLIDQMRSDWPFLDERKIHCESPTLYPKP